MAIEPRTAATNRRHLSVRTRARLVAGSMKQLIAQGRLYALGFGQADVSAQDHGSDGQCVTHICRYFAALAC
jgi:hypothetical protein